MPNSESLALALSRIQHETLISRLQNITPETATALWGDAAAGDFVGWKAPPSVKSVQHWQQLADDFVGEACETLILIGIGGSALGARLLSQVLPKVNKRPTLIILDTLDHTVITQVCQNARPAHCKIILASKSGSTLEINLLYRHFFAWMQAAMPDADAQAVGHLFVAITDPHSALERLAQAQHFFAVVQGDPTIGGRFSAFSPFGLFPAACAGVDIQAVQAQVSATHALYHAFHHENTTPAKLPLGAQWAASWWAGHAQGKMLLACGDTDLLTQADQRLGVAWFEQLVAESTGKGRFGLLPFYAAPPPLDPASPILANSLSFVLCDEGANASLVSTMVHAFYATALYGALQGMNPFDQPDVESSKVALGEAMASQTPFDLSRVSAAQPTLADLHAAINAWRQQKPSGGFVAILDYQTTTHRATQDWSAWLPALQRSAQCPITSIEGPALLHSVGQLYKGADMAQEALFVVLISPVKPAEDLAIPNETYGFSTLRAWQALADVAVMRSRGRHVVVLPSC